MKERAPIHGLAGISEGATVGSVLFVRRASDDESFHVLISVCALTSPVHARIYENGMVSPVASIHLVGDGDTSDVRHMVGRTAALFGPGSGVACFTGGHKLPTLNGVLRCQFVRLHFSLRLRLRDATASTFCAQASTWPKWNANHALQFPPAGRVCSYVEHAGRCIATAAQMLTALRFQWQYSGMLRLSLTGFLLRHASTELKNALESITCHTLVLSRNHVTKCFIF